MAKIYKLYTREIFDNLKYRPTWLPGTPISLGTIGLIEDGVFRPITSLRKLNIPFEEVIDLDRDSIDYNSKTGVAITFKAAGELNQKFEAISEASAGALIEFSRVGAIILQLRGVAIHRISDQATLNKEMMRSIIIGGKDQWQRKWVVITEVINAESATIMISNSMNSKLELKASGTIAPTSLVDASANLSIVKENQVSTKIISKSGLTPLYRGVRVKKKYLWLFDEVQVASSDTPEIDDVFGGANPNEDSIYDSIRE
jgi:hypothetical protein